MFLAEADPTKAILTVAITLIGAVVAFFKWQSAKDANTSKATANWAAGNSEEIKKLWGKVDESEQREKKLREDLDKSLEAYRRLEIEHRELKVQLGESQVDCRQLQKDCNRLHSENKELTLKINSYHGDVTRLQKELDESVADRRRLHEQNGQQAAQITSLEKKLERKLETQRGANGEQ